MEAASSSTADVEALTRQLVAHLDRTIAAKSSWSFTQAFILGQLTVIIVLVAFIRYLVLEDEKGRWSRRNRKAKPIAFVNQPSPTNADLLEKVFYDKATHPPEGMDWLNVLVAQAISGYREDAADSDQLLVSLTEALNGPRRPSWLSPIQVTDVDLGQEYPLFSNARIKAAEESGRMRAEIDFDFKDSLTLGVSTAMSLNWPKPSFARLPISLSVTVEKITATLLLEFSVSPPSSASPSRALHLSLQPDFSTRLGVSSFLGAHSQLQDLPKITQLIESSLRGWVQDRCVWPKYQVIPLPTLWKVRDATVGQGPTNVAAERAERGEDTHESEDDISREEAWLAAQRTRQASGDVDDYPDVVPPLQDATEDGIDLDLDNMTSISMRTPRSIRPSMGYESSTSSFVSMPGAIPIRRKRA